MRAAENPEPKPANKLDAYKAYSDKIKQTYSYPFGKDQISLPGNAAVAGNNFLPPSAFPTAAYCGHCHQEAYHQWRQSLHANAFRAPFYRTSVNILIRTKGIAYARHCDSCHNPIAVVSGLMTPSAQGDRSFDRDGVTCMVCHSIQSVASKEGNGGYVMGIPAVIVDANGNPIPGIVPDAEILAHLDRHSKAVMKDFYKSPVFCAACHKASLPPELNDYKWIRAFTTYDEWQESKFSQETPLTYYTAKYKSCQDCHMMEVPAVLPDYGARHGMIASHRWLAGNTGVPFYYGYKEQLQKTIEFLKSGNYLNLDLFALRLGEMGPMIAPLGSVPFTLKAGTVVEAYVVIQSKAIGHSLLPEVRDLYQAWVHVTVKDADGATIYHSGFVNPDGTVDERAHIFTNRPVNESGDFVDDHMVWTIHSVAYDNTIQAGSSTLVRYQFLIPKNVKGPLTITASVNYRHFRQSYLNNVFGKDHPAYPIVELASRTRVLNIGKNEPTAPLATDNPDWMRWNNVGIGFLGELQYAYAMNAFEHVVRLRPDYADGYINIGLTYLNWEMYPKARGPLEKALTLQPNDARALYYLALVERRARNPRAEDIDLEKVLAQYPDCRQARRELGISYYQQNRGDAAIQQFQALQAIDPDDLAAHYNLSILYFRKGMRKRAMEQAHQYAIKRVDPSAPTYSLDYLRKHPEISIESVPWHLHTDLKHDALGMPGQQ
ncbi:MAG TPA: tetratricopeptide repeat protein [Acidobacteriaceae bacterium]|nr:tetratricopeptide repeat protein [Acidobacteriaceae bacterium]